MTGANTPIPEKGHNPLRNSKHKRKYNQNTQDETVRTRAQPLKPVRTAQVVQTLWECGLDAMKTQSERTARVLSRESRVVSTSKAPTRILRQMLGKTHQDVDGKPPHQGFGDQQSCLQA